MGQRILLTGGAGFIGSHTALVLMEQGHSLVVLDNFDNSSPALERVCELAEGQALELIEGDVVTQRRSTARSKTATRSTG